MDDLDQQIAARREIRADIRLSNRLVGDPGVSPVRRPERKWTADRPDETVEELIKDTFPSDTPPTTHCNDVYNHFEANWPKGT